jgi:hypothetical protein
MFIAVRIIEDSRLPAFRGILRLTLLAAGSSLTIQLVYGSLLLIVLKPIGLFRPPVILFAYLVPVLLLSWYMSNTTNDLIGTIPWLVFASILALVFWFFAR